AGDDRRGDLLSGGAVPCPGDAEPDRARRHLPPPGGAARSLHAEGARRLPDTRCGEGDRGTHGVGAADRGPADRRGRRHPGGAQRHRRALHGPEGGGLHRGRGARDSRAACDRAGGAEAADRVRRVAAGVDLSGAGCPGPRLPPGPRVRRARRRQGDGPGRVAPPRAADLRSGSRRHGRRPRDRSDPGGRGRAVTYEGKERRSGATPPVRARRRAVTTEVLRQVKGIELRTRNLVNTLFTGEYRSVFRGQGIEFAEVREYQQGDDFRAIDWNVSARMGHPFVKTFHEEREITLLLVVDQSGSCQFGRPYTKAGLAVEVVLSDFRADGWEDALAQLASGHDVVAITIDDPRERELPDAGWVDMEDAETGQRVLLDTSHGPTRTRVRVAAERQLQERARKLI